MNSELTPARPRGTYEFPKGQEDPIARIKMDLSRFGEVGDLSKVLSDLEKTGESFVEVEAENIRISLRNQVVHYEVVDESDRRTGEPALRGIDLHHAPNPYDEGPTLAQMIHDVQKESQANRGGVLSTPFGRRIALQAVLAICILAAGVTLIMSLIFGSLSTLGTAAATLLVALLWSGHNATKLDRAHRRTRKPLIEVIALPREKRAHLEAQVHILADKLDLDNPTKIELRRVNRDTDMGVMDSSYVYFHGVNRDPQLGGCWVVTNGFTHSLTHGNTLAWWLTH